MNHPFSTRRSFLQTTAGAAAGAVLLGVTSSVSAVTPSSADIDTPLKGHIYTTLEIGMVNIPGSLTERFKAVKAAGYDGIEMDAPGMNVEETIKAIAESGLPVDGTVNFARLGRLANVSPPRLMLPAKWNKWGAALIEEVYRHRGKEPPVDKISVEMAEHYWWIDSKKAHDELGFVARDPQLTLVDTVAYLRRGVDSDL